MFFVCLGGFIFSGGCTHTKLKFSVIQQIFESTNKLRRLKSSCRVSMRILCIDVPVQTGRTTLRAVVQYLYWLTHSMYHSPINLSGVIQGDCLFQNRACKLTSCHNENHTIVERFHCPIAAPSHRISRATREDNDHLTAKREALF